MCVADVYRFKRIPEEAPKKLKDLVHEDASDVEVVCTAARLIEAVEILSK
jgi:hypothetical protein